MMSTTEVKTDPRLKRCGDDFTECMGLVLVLFEEAVKKQGNKSAVEPGTVAALKMGLGLLPAEHQIQSFAGVCVGRWDRIQKQEEGVVVAIVRDLFAKIPLAKADDMVAVIQASPPADKMIGQLLECMGLLAEQVIRYAHLAPEALKDVDAKVEAARFRIRL